MSAALPDAVENLIAGATLTAYLGTSQGNNPHVAPVWYRYDDGVIEITTTGRKLDNIRANPRVSLAIQQAEAGIPEWVVTLRGTAKVVESEEENARARRQINRKYGVDDEEWAENTLVRIEIGSSSHTKY